MFYGRMDIYWPDGPVESHRLEKPTIAIGRSTGNDIVLDTTAVSRYHTTVAFRSQQAALEDLGSVNGTYVDGVRLAANEPYPLRGGEEIQIGDVRLIFHPVTEETLASGDTTQRIVLTQPTYRVQLDGPDMAVAPGAHVQATVRIENLSDDEDHYFLEIDGLPKGWARIDQVELEVPPGGQNQAVISFKPLRRSESLPGDHRFMVRVRSRSNPVYTIDAPTTLHVLPYSGFGMALGATSLVNGDTFSLYVHNQGNAPLPISVQGTDPGRLLHFRLPMSHLTLAPGERQTLSGVIGLRRRRFFGASREHEFSLVARSHDAAGFTASVPGTVSESALLPGWVPALAIPAVLVLALLVVVFVALILDRAGDDEPPTPPVINRFDVSNAALTFGDVTDVNWDVADADAVELSIAQGAVERRVPLTGETGPLPLTFDHTGLYQLTLHVMNGDVESTASATVEVRPSVTLTLQAGDTLTLVQNAEQSVTLAWTVSGAESVEGGVNVQLESSDSTLALPTGPLPATGSQDVTVTPQSESVEWLVTLTAQGADGVIASVTQKLPIVAPICELSVPRTLVRRGPGEDYPAAAPTLERAADGTILSPLARDPSGDWLLVAVASGSETRTGWVMAADFNCTNVDPGQFVVSEDYPAPPAVTPSPTASSSTGTPDSIPALPANPTGTTAPTPRPTPSRTPAVAGP
ncbi:FHA domain-containing protein [Aggregatilinea lenta]|uniref:FHA domain-containing protein n=1 Tax=Aggregatilinea lenta TaxID=913108 RepID=UPI000E5AF247|nr:FHA domain-containing protein [Aggregatilinea lenta]